MKGFLTMKVLGIVSEYNPFHNGHKLHKKKKKKSTGCDFVIAVMSGNFVQRGEPAIFDKWTRTRSALINGVDMVIEIPVSFATASAEFFAECSVRILENSGIIDTISFGSECGNVDYIEKISDILYNEPTEFKELIKEELSKGLTFPVARSKALKKLSCVPKDVLENPNNILGIEYLKALKKINSSITPFTLLREVSHYNSKDMTGFISSATSIREGIKKGDVENSLMAVPENCRGLYKSVMKKGISPIFPDDMSDFLNYKLRMSTPSQIESILDVTEGLENRIINAMTENYSFSDMCSYIKSKRYTFTRIQRVLSHIILDITKEDTKTYIDNGFSQYIRVLGFRKDSSHLLSSLIKNSKIPVITNLKNAGNQLDTLGMKMLEKEIQTTDIYMALCPDKSNSSIRKEFTEPMVII